MFPNLSRVLLLLPILVLAPPNVLSGKRLIINKQNVCKIDHSEKAMLLYRPKKYLTIGNM
jgi:hypothetical protein